MFALPTRFGGLGIGYPVGTASWAFSLSYEGTSVLLNTICGRMDFCLITYLDHVARIHWDLAEKYGVIFNLFWHQWLHISPPKLVVLLEVARGEMNM